MLINVPKDSLINIKVIRKIKRDCIKRKIKYGSRKSPEYEAFRKKVLIRDKYKCQKCGRIRARFQVHHIKGYTQFPQFRLDVENALTYCSKCHYKFHKKYGKTNFPDSRTVEW